MMLPLNHDPYRIFEGSKTPAGLYARQKWLGQKDQYFRKDFNATVKHLFADQDATGGWERSTQVTIQRLFGLHLTVRHASPAIIKALMWLMEGLSADVGSTDPRLFDPDSFESLPLVSGHPALYITSAVLFLCTIFDQHENPTVRRLYENLLQDLAPDVMLQQDPAGLNNVMRALVVHTQYASHEAVSKIVTGLAKHQTKNGTWGDTIPFYQMTNALAHLELVNTDSQLERAFEHLRHTQNADGTWGQQQKEWNTFLAVHALRNKGQDLRC